MFNIKRAFVFAMVLFPLVSVANESVNNESSENVHNSMLVASPAQVVENFYHNYLMAINTNDTEMGDNAINVYVSERLKNEINSSDIDWDYYIDAQDICDDWVENIKTKVIKKKGKQALVQLMLGKGKSKSIYDVMLLNNNGNWKLNSVTLTFRKDSYCF